MALPLQSSGMLSPEQLLHLFRRFSELTSLPGRLLAVILAHNRLEFVAVHPTNPLLCTLPFPEVKKRITDAVRDKQEAVGVTTAIQEEIFLEMGIDPRFGISCLGKVNGAYENDRDLMITFYKFVATEEMACDEAELEPDEFEGKVHSQKLLHEQQLEMLKSMRKYSLDEQSAILEALRQNLENSGFDSHMSVLTTKQIEEILQNRAAT